MRMGDFEPSMRNGSLPDDAYVFSDVQDEIACNALFRVVPRSHATRGRLILSMGSWGNGRPFHAHGPALFGLVRLAPPLKSNGGRRHTSVFAATAHPRVGLAGC
jgi:hypothetical protein